MNYKIISNSDMDTIELAQNIESEKFPNMVICMEGDLGSGKTLFTKAFAKSMGISENITSPTFNIIKEYDGEEGYKLYHMDVYRLSESKEDIGISEYFNKGGVTIIEWADLISDILPKDRLDIRIKIVDENKRVFYITPHGEEYEDLCERVL
ncbi:MAG TPA: tRNA (adenosine(37)-N6)-threonylcarbamoyltransferase complex ATPase subunit type 1 TsaE [Firmicutes bacterium]|jgi:tRNA threonylcarbamoyladenosine biosynthesis protein TsaE|nr:tRNA (adenosine(37)-N6)-threonylcarbamoyltransferase complex ATPase subunit type 1 TsaE [Bacillota bacterium]